MSAAEAARQGFQTEQSVPVIEWDGDNLQFRITFVGVEFKKASSVVATVTSKPDHLFRTRIRREEEEDSWSPGVVTPMPPFGLSWPDHSTRYVVEMCKVNPSNPEEVLPDTTQEHLVTHGSSERIK